MSLDSSGNPLRVLVTGAAGFLGQHVLPALLAKGHRIVAVQNRTQLSAEIRERCDRVVSGDVTDPEVQADALQGADVVCHLAAHLPKSYAGLEAATRCYSMNALATLNLATAAAQTGVRQFVHFSTANMYAQAARPCGEADSLFPIEYATSYMVSKLASEIYLLNISRASSMEAAILRVGSVYGPGEPGNKLVPTLLTQASQGRPLRLVNGGSAKYNFVHVSDVADLAAQLIGSNNQGIYNVASGEHSSLLDLARAVLALYPTANSAVEAEPPTPGAFSGFSPVSIEKAARQFRFSPRSLADGLRDYIEERSPS